MDDSILKQVIFSNLWKNFSLVFAWLLLIVVLCEWKAKAVPSEDAWSSGTAMLGIEVASLELSEKGSAWLSWQCYRAAFTLTIFDSVYFLILQIIKSWTPLLQSDKINNDKWKSLKHPESHQGIKCFLQ